MILKIRQKLHNCEKNNFLLNKRIYDQLRIKLEDIICSLPEDLRTVLSNKNSSR